MCSASKCRVCGKTTWTGCGQHVASVRAQVPANQWCGGHHGEQSQQGRSLFPWRRGK